MSRNATASWSGYAHQGKIGLLVALRKINSFHGTENNLEDYTVSYETQEDVKIFNARAISEVHQVKALRNANTIGSYTEALGIFEACPGSNYLHAICDITNWGNLTPVQNPQNVIRYAYSLGVHFCSLEYIYSYIDDEIQRLLNNRNHEQAGNANWREGGYQEFLARLDDKIRSEHHHNNTATYDVNFTLASIASIFVERPTLAGSKIYAIRQEMFDVYLNFLQDMDDNLIPISDEHEIKVKEAIEAIYYLDDNRFISFLKNINPHTSSGKEFKTSATTDAFFSSENFYTTFLNTIVSVTGSDFTLDGKDIPNYFRDMGYIVTSIQSTEERMKDHAKNILKNESIDFTAYENDYLITQSYDGSLFDSANRLITKSPDSAEKFINKKNMKFISVANAVNKLNEVI